MSTKSQFQPITMKEVSELESKFIAHLETHCGGKDVGKAFASLEFLKIAAENGVTEMGQSYVTKERRRLNKFLGAQ